MIAAQDAVAALQKALAFGLQYCPMAGIALSALERWEHAQPQVSVRRGISNAGCKQLPSFKRCRHEIYADLATAKLAVVDPYFVPSTGTTAAGATSPAAVGPIPPRGLGHGTGSSN